MLYHPTIISAYIIAAMILAFRFDRIFQTIAIIFPLFIAYIIYNLEGTYTYSIMNMQIKADFEDYTILIAYAFTIVILTANLYALGNHRKSDVILGSSYGSVSYLALFAGDMISLIVALELMMILSAIIIFTGGNRRSVRSSKKYFLTHLVSGNMIIIGICYLIMKTGSTEIFNLTEFIDDPEYSTLIISIMLIGLIINIAAFPFSGWMVNYYPDASPSGFIYLISFTTKVSVIILMKFFAGYDLLKYIAIVMIIYSSIKAVLEKNIFSALCLLSIMQIGFLVIIISIVGKEPWMLHAASSYLFLHIMYKALLSLSAAAIADHGKIYYFNNLKRIKNPAIIFGLVIGIISMINLPLTSTFTIKTHISNFFMDNKVYFIIVFLSMMTTLVLPWHTYIKSQKTVTLHLNTPTKIAIYLCGIAVLIATFFANYLPFLSQIPTFQNTTVFSADSMKQLTIIATAIIISMLLKRTRIHSYTLNIIELLGDMLFFLYYYVDKIKIQRKDKEPLISDNTGRQIMSKIQIMHNQQTAIFIVFIIFMVLLVSFVMRGV